MSIHKDAATINEQSYQMARNLVMAMARVFNLKTSLSSDDDFSKIIASVQDTFKTLLEEK